MHIYRGKYPNRIYTAFKANGEDREIKAGMVIVVTNGGAMYEAKCDRWSAFHSFADLQGIEIRMPYDTIAHRGAIVSLTYLQQSNIRKAKTNG